MSEKAALGVPTATSENLKPRSLQKGLNGSAYPSSGALSLYIQQHQCGSKGFLFIPRRNFPQGPVCVAAAALASLPSSLQYQDFWHSEFQICLFFYLLLSGRRL